MIATHDIDSKGNLEQKERVLTLEASCVTDVPVLVRQLRMCVAPVDVLGDYPALEQADVSYFGCLFARVVKQEGALSWNERWLVGHPGMLVYYERAPPCSALQSVVVSECVLRADSGRLLLNLSKPNGVSIEFRLVAPSHRLDLRRTPG